jgi:hypothetical protein
VTTGKARAGLKEWTVHQVVGRSWASDGRLRPGLEQSNSEGIENEEEEQPRVSDLPEEDSYTHRDKDLLAPGFGNGTENRIEQRGTLCLDGTVQQFIAKKEALASGGKRQANEEKGTEESKKKGALHKIG